MALLNVQQYPVLTIVIDKDFIDPQSVTTAQGCVFSSFLSGGFTMAVINLPARKLEKRTSVHCSVLIPF